VAILRYTASADNTITNALQSNLQDRGSGSNMGYADSLEVFSIYGQTSGSVTGRTEELSRILVQFPITTIATDRTAGNIPASGSVNFYLKMFNAETPFTLPQDFTLTIAPVSQSWTEGTGLDMDEYKDLGYSNWMSASSTTGWTSVGGDYRTASNYNVTFPLGYEDLEVDVSYWVEHWLAGTFDNHGFGIRLTGSQEAYHSSSTGADVGPVINNLNGSTDSYFTKKFFARSTQYFFDRPVIEARWDSRIGDNREDFVYSSSLAPATDNLNTIYLYNYIRGRLVNVPLVGTGEILVSLYSGSTAPTGSKILVNTSDLNVTGGWVKTGIYSASMAITAAATPIPAIYDVWHSGGIEYFTGSIYPELMPTYDLAPTFNRITSCTNLKKSYFRQDKARFRFFIRNRDWNPTIYTVASKNNPTDVVVSASYAVYRITDNYAAISYGTGSDYSTYMSYDKGGNYFDLDLSLLEGGYMYEIKLSYYNDSIGDWQEQPQTFKFRVEE